MFAVVDFAAGGQGGGHPQAGNCAPQRLIDAAARYRSTARIPTLWLYAANNFVFRAGSGAQDVRGFRSRGRPGGMRCAAAFGSDGHGCSGLPMPVRCGSRRSGVLGERSER